VTDTPTTITSSSNHVNVTDATNDGSAADTSVVAASDPDDSIDLETTNATDTGDSDPVEENVADSAAVSTEPADAIDLDAMDADFVAVERALARLAHGTYWIDEVTGRPIPDDVLIADPTTRRAAQG
jgi:RNA polymerase-binding transcription factor DksA